MIPLVAAMREGASPTDHAAKPGDVDRESASPGVVGTSTSTASGSSPAGSRSRRRPRWLVWLTLLGPGIIATAAGNDAGGVLTYIQSGASFGYGLIWSIVLITVGYYVVQEMCSRMGAVTGKGLADLIRENYGVKVTLFAMVVLLVANLATTVTEFAGISTACTVLGFSPPMIRYICIPVAVAITWFLVVGSSYEFVERVFLGMSALLLAYVVTALKLHPQWLVIGHQTIDPPFRQIAEHHRGALYVNMLIALIGTTIAPYQQFYLQSSIRDKGISVKNYVASRIDVLVGCIVSNIISIFIVIACAITLFAHNILNVNDIQSAWYALKPLVGVHHIQLARYLFAIGLLGASMLAAVVVPLTTAYAVTESLGWETGVGRRLKESPLFYVTYATLILFGGALVMIPSLDRHLVPLIIQAQVLNAALLPVELVLMILLCNKRRLMGQFQNSLTFNIVAWVTIAITISLSIANFFLTIIHGGS